MDRLDLYRGTYHAPGKKIPGRRSVYHRFLALVLAVALIAPLGWGKGLADEGPAVITGFAPYSFENPEIAGEYTDYLVVPVGTVLEGIPFPTALTAYDENNEELLVEVSGWELAATEPLEQPGGGTIGGIAPGIISPGIGFGPAPAPEPIDNDEEENKEPGAAEEPVVTDDEESIIENDEETQVEPEDTEEPVDSSSPLSSLGAPIEEASFECVAAAV
jgi:hypothetical protein